MRRIVSPTIRESAKKSLRRSLAQALAEARMRQGLTQQEVGERARLPQSVVARLESGSRNFTIDNFARVAAVLGLDIRVTRGRRSAAKK